jgi:hypothetical protein
MLNEPASPPAMKSTSGARNVKLIIFIISY